MKLRKCCDVSNDFRIPPNAFSWWKLGGKCFDGNWWIMNNVCNFMREFLFVETTRDHRKSTGIGIAQSMTLLRIIKLNSTSPINSSQVLLTTNGQLWKISPTKSFQTSRKCFCTQNFWVKRKNFETGRRKQSLKEQQKFISSWRILDKISVMINVAKHLKLCKQFLVPRGRWNF